MQRRDAESSEHIRVPYVINEEVVEEEEGVEMEVVRKQRRILKL